VLLKHYIVIIFVDASMSCLTLK